MGQPRGWGIETFLRNSKIISRRLHVAQPGSVLPFPTLHFLFSPVPRAGFSCQSQLPTEKQKQAHFREHLCFQSVCFIALFLTPLSLDQNLPILCFIHLGVSFPHSCDYWWKWTLKTRGVTDLHFRYVLLGS